MLLRRAEYLFNYVLIQDKVVVCILAFWAEQVIFRGISQKRVFNIVLLRPNLAQNAAFGGWFLAEQQNRDTLHLLAESWDGDGTISAEVKEE